MFLLTLSFLRAGHHAEHANEEHNIDYDSNEEHDGAGHGGRAEVLFERNKARSCYWTIFNILKEPKVSHLADTLAIEVFLESLEDSIKVRGNSS